ncbi:MAG TPA: carboxypeptidase-like regulatory domain-containing protein [Terriglobales bacterium]|nr:carboxypeptidase-like regulatory domain-containing protein [Terriglobales bacterium]
MAFPLRSAIIFLLVVPLEWALPCRGQLASQAPASATQDQGAAQPNKQPPGQPLPGTINGTVLDQSGALVVGAVVKLSGEDKAPSRETRSDTDGQFSFAKVAPGPFQLTVSSQGFGSQTISGSLHSGEIDQMPPIVLTVATNVTEVQVGVSQIEVAEEQIKIEEQQRVLGVIPNFYVTYIPNAAPLNPRQKFKLAWKTMIDPVTFVVVGGLSGVQQAQNHFRGYGQGADGYAKRFGANYTDTATSTFIGGAILASLLKQDPRYFYKGTGRAQSRLLYAIANAFICKGDNRHWQPNYSNVLGNLAAGGISNLYYPSQDRNGAGLTFENAGVGIVAGAFTNILQEFVIPKLTPNHKHDPSKP